MKPLIASIVASTSAVATGALLVIAGGEVAVAIVLQDQISGDTPIGGLTLGAVLAGIAAGLGFLWWGGKQLVQLGGYLAALKSDLEEGKAYAETLKEVSAQVDANTRALAALEEWRAVVGPTVQEHETRLRGRPPGMEDRA